MEDVQKKIVVVGGGTGTHTILAGLKAYTELDLTAIVAMTDSGGSTGRLRDEFGYLPVGDARMALVALARETGVDDELLRKLFLHRFSTDGDVSGHSFGNLFIVALTDILGSEEAAIEATARILNVCGKVLPVTRTKADLIATYDDGSTVVGEHHIDEPEHLPRRKIVSLSTTEGAELSERAKGALLEADYIILGPGDLYTSVLANCVIPGFPTVLGQAKGKLIYIGNLMTKRGQTEGMTLGDHVDEIERYGKRAPNIVVMNTTPLPADLLLRYREEGDHPVVLDTERIQGIIVQGDFLAPEIVHRVRGDMLKRSLIRHDSTKIARALVDIF